MKARTSSWLLAATVAGALATAPVGAAEQGRAGGETQAASPKEFIKHAAVGGMAEVKLGTLAQQRAASEEVKDFGKRMVDDHGKANAELKRIADKKDVTLPKDIDEKHRAVHDRLAKLRGEEFDREYMKAMLEDHRHDVAAFRQASRSDDPDVRAFASETLPKLEEHLQTAERLAMSGDARGSERGGGER
jgi:putative membrane protein